jgi:hypothetical protein
MIRRPALHSVFALWFVVGSVSHALGSAPRPADAVATGTLIIASDPVRAVVYVDGRFVGQTPIDELRLPAGDHRVRVTKDGYLENGRIVTIAANKSRAIQIRLTARGPAAPSGQSPPLKIVVVEGEDAVNIIDKKTAVKPTVEVRDRNDLPVAGASVVFLIDGGRSTASFAGGLRQLTVTTDSLGRATTTELSPLGKGAFRIQVRAAYQGQTASATIHQTNFATAAQAAQATQSSAAGQGASSAGSSGGGLSAGAIAGIAAGVAGAAVGASAFAHRDASGAQTETLNLTGAYTGTVTVSGSPGGSMAWNLRQSGTMVTGTDNGFLPPITTYNGIVSGTLSGTTLTFSISVPAGAASTPGCTINMNGTADVTNSTISGSFSGTSTCLNSLNGVFTLRK